MKAYLYISMTIVLVHYVLSEINIRVSGEIEKKLIASDQRLDELVYRVVNTRKILEKMDKKRKEKMNMIKWITKLMDDNDDDGQWKSNKKFKCGNSVEYIFPFSVCDGIVDCDDGSDEDNSTTCVNPVIEGSVWKGLPIYNKCNSDTCQNVVITILSTRRPHWFSAYIQIKARLEIIRILENKETRVETSTIVGAYSFGTQSLFMHTWKTMSNRIVLLAQFDGIYSDMCHGYQVHDTTMRTCAEYKFFRQS